MHQEIGSPEGNTVYLKKWFLNFFIYFSDFSPQREGLENSFADCLEKNRFDNQ